MSVCPRTPLIHATRHRCAWVGSLGGGHLLHKAKNFQGGYLFTRIYAQVLVIFGHLPSWYFGILRLGGGGAFKHVRVMHTYAWRMKGFRLFGTKKITPFRNSPSVDAMHACTRIHGKVMQTLCHYGCH